MSADLRRATAVQLRAGYRSGEFTPVEAVEALLHAIAREDAALGAWLHLRGDEVRKEASAAEVTYAAARASGVAALDALPPLFGVPVALKDLVNMIGTPTTAGSTATAGARP